MMLAEFFTSVLGSDRTTEALASLETLSAREWCAGLAWAEQQGIDLYFFDRLRELGSLEAIPEVHRSSLELKRAEHATGVSLRFDQFRKYNERFLAEGWTFCNMRGFGLMPASFTDPALRRPFPLEVMSLMTLREQLESALAGYGYSRRFSAPQLDIYEIEVAGDSASSAHKINLRTYLATHETGAEDMPAFGLMDRRHWQTFNGFAFPAPLPCEHLIAQAIGIHGKMGTSEAILSPLFEFSNFVRHWISSQGFWEETIRLAEEHPIRLRALRAVSAAAASTFSVRLPEPLKQWIERTAAYSEITVGVS